LFNLLESESCFRFYGGSKSQQQQQQLATPARPNSAATRRHVPGGPACRDISCSHLHRCLSEPERIYERNILPPLSTSHAPRQRGHVRKPRLHACTRPHVTRKPKTPVTTRRFYPSANGRIAPDRDGTRHTSTPATTSGRPARFASLALPATPVRAHRTRGTDRTGQLRAAHARTRARCRRCDRWERLVRREGETAPSLSAVVDGAPVDGALRATRELAARSLSQPAI
jgi:hypothetical protein